MATSTKIGEISSALKLIDVKKQNLYDSFLQLQSQSQSQSQSSLSSFFNFNFNLKWTDLDSYFTFIQLSLQQKFNFLKTLHSFCENSDSLGLQRFIAISPDKASILTQLPDAYQFAPNAAAMVLDAVAGFYSPYDDYDDECRNACLIMLEALLLFKNKNDINKHCSIELLKDKALEIALLWNYHRNTLDSVHAKQQNALAFLLIVAAYNLLDGFPINDVIDYFVVVADKPLAIHLCRQMIPNDNVNDLIQKLINEDMHIAAVNFSIQLQKTDEFPPIHLLEERKLMSTRIIDETCKNVENPHKKDVTLREIDTLKAIINCIEENHLESKYPKDSVVELVRKLENEVEESKRALVNEMGFRKQPARASALNKQLLPKTKRPKQNKFHPTTTIQNVMPIQEPHSQASNLLPDCVDQCYNSPLSFYAPHALAPSGNSNGWISD